MKIAGEVDDDQAHLTAYLYCRKLDISSYVEFHIDTGATRTVLSQRDARKAGIDFTALRRGLRAFGIGGTIPTYVLPKSQIILIRADRPAIYTHEFKQLSVTRYEGKSRKLRKIANAIPSLLGMDFLKHFDIKFRGSKFILESHT